jgi:hypothetical protein
MQVGNASYDYHLKSENITMKWICYNPCKITRLRTQRTYLNLTNLGSTKILTNTRRYHLHSMYINHREVEVPFFQLNLMMHNDISGTSNLQNIPAQIKYSPFSP